MAITNAQQYQQLVNKPADGKRPGYRGPGGYQGGPSGDVERPGGNRDNERDNIPDRNRGQQYTKPKSIPDRNRGQQYTKPKPKKATPMDVREQARVGNTIKEGDVLKGPTRPTGDNREGLEIFKAKRPTVSFPSFGPFSYLQKPIQTFSDFTAGKNRKFFEDVIRAGKIPGLSFTMTEDELEKKYQDYMADRLAGKIDAFGNPLGGRFRDSQGNIVGGREGPDNQPVPQADPTTTASTTTTTTTSDEDEDEINRGLAARFAGSLFDFDNLRENAMDGGIMNTDVIGGFADDSMDEMGRQMYGLGKLVKKVTRSVKKIAKSPIGKAALLYGAGSLGASLLGKAKAGGGLGFLKNKLFGTALPKALGRDAFMGMAGKTGTKGLLAKLGLTKGFGSMVPTALGGIGLASLTAGALTPKQKQELLQEEEDDFNLLAIRNNPYAFTAPRFEGSQFVADGGRIGYQEGGDAEPVAKKTMPLIDMDGMEKDYRETGGFVEMGRMERADDVPARLSKNEFVFTADAVRNAGDGNIDKGAEVMYNMMKNLESGGEVSEESQGLEGARKMFQTSQRLGEVI
jgi:hypothetical protein